MERNPSCKTTTFHSNVRTAKIQEAQNREEMLQEKGRQGLRKPDVLQNITVA